MFVERHCPKPDGAVVLFLFEYNGIFPFNLIQLLETGFVFGCKCIEYLTSPILCKHTARLPVHDEAAKRYLENLGVSVKGPDQFHDMPSLVSVTTSVQPDAK